MQFTNKLSLAVALLATSTLSLPTYRNANDNVSSAAGAAGSKCSEEGRVVCGNKQFQICASGQWSVSMRLAEGTDCSVFGAGSDAGTGTLPENPSDVPVVPSVASSGAATLPTPEIPIPTTTVATVATTASAADSESSDVGGGFYQNHRPTQGSNKPTTTEQPTVPSSTAPVQQPPSQTKTQTASPPSNTGSSSSGGNTTPGTFQLYTGPEANYPKEDKWVSYDTLWDLNKQVCERPDNAGKGPILKQYIKEVADEAGMDARVVLAVILQESTCNLGVGSTDGGVNNPGIMQSHDGVSYKAGDADSVIKEMIKDGTTGTSSGMGLVQFIEGEGGKLYTGLRAYNSGENGVDASNLFNLPAGTGTASYCSDIANRLTGAKTEHM